MNSLEKLVVIEGLGEIGVSNERLLTLYRGASDVTKADGDVMLKLCSVVTAEKELEVIVRKAIKSSWHPKLVEAYANLGKETAQKRLKIAQGWRKIHPIDASLSYCVGTLHETLGNKEEAIVAFESAIETSRHRWPAASSLTCMRSKVITKKVTSF